MAKTYTLPELKSALRRLGELLEPYGVATEIALVGGAAGLLSYQLTPELTTKDCDMIICRPGAAEDRLMSHARDVATELGMDDQWLNGDIQIAADKMPDGWDARKVEVLRCGLLAVHAISRVDLIAMKILSGRDVDIEHLHLLQPDRHELDFSRAYLDEVLASNPPRLPEIEHARLLILALRETAYEY